MTIVFIVCAAVGGTVLVIQFLLALIGLGGESLDLDVAHDFGGDFHGDVGGDFHVDTSGHVDHASEHGSTWLFGVLSFRTIVAALAFFGLAGLAMQSTGTPKPVTLLVAAAAGLVAMMVVYWMMRTLRQLRADGTVRINEAVGRHGNVYLRVPANHSGSGKIHLNLQNRTVECLAVTGGPELATGADVVVTSVVGPTTLEVQRPSP